MQSACLPDDAENAALMSAARECQELPVLWCHDCADLFVDVANVRVFLAWLWKIILNINIIMKAYKKNFWSGRYFNTLSHIFYLFDLFDPLIYMPGTRPCEACKNYSKAILERSTILYKRSF